MVEIYENPPKKTNVMLVRSQKELMEQNAKVNFNSFKTNKTSCLQ